MRSVGKHALIDLHWNPENVALTDSSVLMDAMRSSVEAAGATILNEHTNSFNGGGFTGFFVLAESHASVHTWPEHGIATLDIFMCGQCDAFQTLDNILEILKGIDNAPNHRLETKVFRGFQRREEDTEGTEGS